MKKTSTFFIVVGIAVMVILGALLVESHIELSYSLRIRTINTLNYSLILPIIQGWDNFFDRIQITGNDITVSRGTIDGKTALVIKGGTNAEITAKEWVWGKSITRYSFPTGFDHPRIVTKAYCNYTPEDGNISISNYLSYGTGQILPHGLTGDNYFGVDATLQSSWQMLSVRHTIGG